jgi:hypothetical protein
VPRHWGTFPEGPLHLRGFLLKSLKDCLSLGFAEEFGLGRIRGSKVASIDCAGTSLV